MRHEAAREADESLEVGAGPLKIRATGQRLAAQLSIVAGVGIVLFFGWEHHTGSREMLQRILEATAENTYVLSLSQAERERLNIAMPESLRRKVRRGRDGE